MLKVGGNPDSNLFHILSEILFKTGGENMTTKLRNAKKWLEEMQFTPERIVLSYPNGEKQGLKVDTDYEGPYPGNDVFQIHNMIRSHISRHYRNSLSVESRGHYSAVFIIEQ